MLTKLKSLKVAILAILILTAAEISDLVREKDIHEKLEVALFAIVAF